MIIVAMQPSTSSAAANASGADAPVPQGALRLDDWGVIRARGEDAATFLQGQLTNDVLGLGAGEARLAGYCSAKGRLLATFVVWRDAAGDFLLACSADLLAPTLKRLSMFVLRAKCKLSDASTEVPLWGLAGEAGLAALGQAAPPRAWAVVSLTAAGQAAQAVRLPDAPVGGIAVPRVLFAGLALPSPAPALEACAWQWLEAKSGTARIVAATVEQFVPQMVNLELVGGVNFQKGCYPGQEVVARSQYRGTLKRRAFVVSGSEGLRPGQEVFHEADPGQPAGMVVLAGAHAGAFAGLVELKLAAAEGGTLHLGRADGTPLALGTLPYSMPMQEA
ncbi:MAG: folate-binding protein YgfZ [Burkholderiales bacterium]|nr:folate-binding protein YgfZ [Burkholderiales bacterium]